MEWSNEIGLEVEMISFVRSAGIPQQMISHMTESESGLGPLQGDMKGQVLEKNKRGGFFIIRVVFDLRCYGRGKLNINLLLFFFLSFSAKLLNGQKHHRAGVNYTLTQAFYVRMICLFSEYAAYVCMHVCVCVCVCV